MKWTREDLIIAFALYCVTPLKRINTSNKVIAQAAEAMSRSLPSLVMCMRNFQHLDETTEKGLGHTSKGQRSIYEEFKADWGGLSLEAEHLTGLALFEGSPEQGAKPISSRYDHNAVNRERYFFRKSVFASYDGKCCISGLPFSDLLTASHIKPYSACRDRAERVDPSNGLLLSALYDRAFENGYITLTKDYTFRVAGDPLVKAWFSDLEGQSLVRPARFLPSLDAIEYHNDVIFEKRIG